MPKYHTRYVKEHYVKRDIKRELYEAFIEWCGERSINICLEKALSILRGNIPLNVRGNIAPNTGAQSITQSSTQSKAKAEERTSASSSEGYEWCRDKDKVRNLKNFLKWVDEKMGLIDWWRAPL